MRPFGHHFGTLFAYALYFFRHHFLHRCLTAPFSDFGLPLGSFGIAFLEFASKMASKMGGRGPVRCTIFHDIFHTSTATCILVDFWHPLAPKWHPNGSQKTLLGPICLHTFGFVFRTSTFGYILVAIWIPFGYLLAPFSPLVPFCSPQGSIFSLLGSPSVI